MPSSFEGDGASRLRAELRTRASATREREPSVQQEIECNEAAEFRLGELSEFERDRLRITVTAELKRSRHWLHWTAKVREETVRRRMLSQLSVV